MNRVWLLGFPEDEAAALCVQLGRIASGTPVESRHEFDPESLDVDPESLVFLFDSHVAIGQTMRLFQHVPACNLVILAQYADAEHASQLMQAGAMDYRVLPCPDEVLEIYLRKAEHQAQLSTQATEQRLGSDEFVTQDIETRRLLDKVALIAPSNASVLILGESGTGKERLAHFIRQCSNRKDNAFVAINCAAIPEGVLEAELFGHEKGAFTGATHSRPGKFELAHEGTLLLDEITEMPLHLQATLLRVLQEGEVDRIGGSNPVKIDVRIIATSNRNMVDAVQEGKFRQDLYYRLNVVSVQLPPLRSRPEDIQPLAIHFLGRFAEMYGKPSPGISPACLTRLRGHDWPGNARELENCMHRAFLMCVDNTLQAEHLGLENEMNQRSEAHSSIQAGLSIRDMEQALIKQTIKHVNGNRTEAAKLLGISIRTLRNKLHDMGSGTPFAESHVAQQTAAANTGGIG
jgi:DNA-binding NtrC family response regulator